MRYRRKGDWVEAFHGPKKKRRAVLRGLARGIARGKSGRRRAKGKMAVFLSLLEEKGGKVRFAIPKDFEGGRGGGGGGRPRLSGEEREGQMLVRLRGIGRSLKERRASLPSLERGGGKERRVPSSRSARGIRNSS